MERLQKTFGKDEYGFALLPKKYSNVKISRIFNGWESGCSWCFPHGIETKNATARKRKRNWKCKRETQYCV